MIWFEFLPRSSLKQLRQHRRSEDQSTHLGGQVHEPLGELAVQEDLAMNREASILDH